MGILVSFKTRKNQALGTVGPTTLEFVLKSKLSILKTVLICISNRSTSLVRPNIWCGLPVVFRNMSLSLFLSQSLQASSGIVP